MVRTQRCTSPQTTDRATGHIFKNDIVALYERMAGHANRLLAEELTYKLWDGALLA
jgi:hypothetical protein